MTINKLIEELIKLKNEGKGEYKVKAAFYSDVFDVGEPIIFDDEKEIFL